MLRLSQSGTVHRIKRQHPATARNVSTQTIPIQDLKRQIQAAATSPDPLPRLRQLRHSPLYESVWQAGSAAVGTVQRDPVTAQAHARLAAEAFTTCHALDAITRLSDAYHFRLTARTQGSANGSAAPAADQAFFEQITPTHMTKLIDEFQRTWARNDERRQAALLSALGAECAAQLELPLSATHHDCARLWGVLPAERRLTKAELLALVDYVNSGTGTFNAVNGAAMAGAYYGDKILSGLMSAYATALNGAVAKLCEHPYFGRTDIVTYKGINLRNPSGRFRLDALEQAVGTGKIIAFPNVLSATADPEQSYAAKKYFNGYTIECQIRMPKAFDADPFHDNMTVGEQEVIGPAGQRFVVTAKQTVEIFQWESGRNEDVDRYLLEPAAGAAR